MRDREAPGGRRHFARLVRAPLRLVPPGAVVRILRGPLRGKRWVAGAGPDGCWLGSYERANQSLAQDLVRPGDVVYDLGANVGYFTLLFSELAGGDGRVVAYEPLPRNLEFLRRHLALNRRTNVEVVAAAVGAAAGTMRFADQAGACQGRLDPHGRLQVEVTTLDREVFDLGRPAPNALKLDVEGGEAHVLDGAAEILARFRPAVWIETHGWQAHQECRERLRRHAYGIEQARDSGVSGFGLLLARGPRRDG